MMNIDVMMPQASQKATKCADSDDDNQRTPAVWPARAKAASA
jgi:hypothetical protein